MAALRWGILSAGKVSFDFALALGTLPQEEHTITAVAARSQERAKEFGEKFGIKKCYGSYEELAKDSEVDVIYVGSLHLTHKELSLLCLRHGKHVLCEKPITMNSKELEEVLKVAKENNVFFMEAFWTRFFPLYQDLQQMIKNGVIGDVRVVNVTFGFQVIETWERVMDPKQGGSTLLEIGVYTLNIADIVYDGEEPENVDAVGFLNDLGTDLTDSITLMYSKRRFAQLLISSSADLPNEAIIIGTKGKIVVKFPFYCSEEIEVNGELKKYPLPSTKYPTNYPNSAGMRYEAEHVRQCLLASKVESDVMTHNTSRRMMKFLDQVREQLGVKFESD